ncbi:tape measure protein [Neorhizobium sp. JUb45]|uniref:tape measure protein n=1 Tax=Neorhizobium sp. JUb45 TaxID=2485113 RepID=UPI0010ECBF7B|nr:tape measure protein [Neorhizobium sp. JUb45]TCR01063.1 tape measure domain-containing protein [Neorhizobium sp. JUb45]
MATDVERLIVALEARTKAFENAMAKQAGVASKRAKEIEGRFEKMNSKLEKSFTAMGREVSGGFFTLAKGFAAALAGSAVTRSLLQLSESATRIDNSLKVAGLSGQELEKVYQGLSKAAMANGAPIETLAGLYGKAAQSQKELGVSTDELLGFTNNVAVALRVAGTDAQTASGALLQLGQALGSGKVQAEEFNSILEGAQPIAQAVAAGLKEANGSISQLKSLVVDGKISSEAFFRAFEAGSVILEDKAARATFTVAQAGTNLWNALTEVVREFNNSTGASETFARGIDGAAQSIADFDVAGLIQKIRDARSELEGFFNSIPQWDGLNELLGVTNDQGQFINPDVSEAETKIAGLERDLKLLQERIAINTDLGFDNTEALARIGEVQQQLSALRAQAANFPATIDGYTIGENGFEAVPDSSAAGTNGQMGGSSIRGGRRRRVVKPVSISDFKPPTGGKSGGGGRKGGGSRQNEYQREIEQIKQRTAAMTAETAALSKLDPLIDDFGYSLELARTKQELLNAAQQAGIKITPEVQASIDVMAQGYATASAAAERLSETQDKARERADFFADTAYDAFSELIPKIETGNAALDKFLNTLIEAVAQAALLGKGPLAGIGGGGGIFGGLFKIFGFANGGIAARGRPMKKFAGGGISRTAAVFGEAGPEAAVPLPDGRRIPVDLRLPLVGGRGGGAVLNYSPVINAQGADQAAIARLERQQKDIAKNMETMVDSRLKTRDLRKTRAQ